jgi:hypothetical protein
MSFPDARMRKDGPDQPQAPGVKPVSEMLLHELLSERLISAVGRHNDGDGSDVRDIGLHVQAGSFIIFFFHFSPSP